VSGLPPPPPPPPTPPPGWTPAPSPRRWLRWVGIALAIWVAASMVASAVAYPFTDHGDDPAVTTTTIR
jgi:hypothetical protein